MYYYITDICGKVKVLELQGHHHSHHRDFSQYGGGRGALRGGGPVGRTAVGGQPAGRPGGRIESQPAAACRQGRSGLDSPPIF